MAGLAQRIANDMKAALLGGDRFVGETLRGLRAVILNEEVNAGLRQQGLGDQAIEQLVAREIKKRQESAALYRQNGRSDLAEVEEREAVVLQAYVPDPVDEAAIIQAVDQAIAATGAGGPQQLGQVIGTVKARLGVAADGAMVARIAKQRLADQG